MTGEKTPPISSEAGAARPRRCRAGGRVAGASIQEKSSNAGAPGEASGAGAGRRASQRPALPNAHKAAAAADTDQRAARLLAEENREEARVAATRIGLQSRSRRELSSIAKGLEVHRARSGQASLGLTALSVGASTADDLAERIAGLCRDPVTSEMVSILLQSRP
jgi:hypothetical protein